MASFVARPASLPEAAEGHAAGSNSGMLKGEGSTGSQELGGRKRDLEKGRVVHVLLTAGGLLACENMLAGADARCQNCMYMCVHVH